MTEDEATKRIHDLLGGRRPEPDLIPVWAVGKASGSYTEVGAVLPTRNGQTIGNSVVMMAGVLKTGKDTTVPAATVMTDCGNVCTFTENELRQYFHQPKYLRFHRPRIEQEVQPVPMILHCPCCGAKHVDAPDERTPGWTNPPHRSHLCHVCSFVWRPADVPTIGVEKIETKGKADSDVGDVEQYRGALADEIVGAMMEAFGALVGGTHSPDSVCGKAKARLRTVLIKLKRIGPDAN